MSQNKEIKFSIYNPVITYQHRSAYDEIVSQLQEIFPICNQGKCKALEVSDDPQKQKQINDLMERVEFFSKSLIQITNVFFDQLYRAREASAVSISDSIATIKIDMIERNLLERTCDVRWWALESAFWECVDFCNSTPKAGDQRSKTKGKYDLVKVANDRLEDIRTSYTLYRDLVIADKNGIIVANSNADRRTSVIGLDVGSEEWFKGAIDTKDGTEYYVQDTRRSVLEDEDALIYSTAIRENGDESGVAIGVLGVLFDFQGESSIILNDYLPTDNEGDTLEGCFSFFSNKSGQIISSSGEQGIKAGSELDLPKRHRELIKAGDSAISMGPVMGRDSLIVSRKTCGFDDYKGLGWSSHYVLPLNSIFQSLKEQSKLNIEADKLLDSNLIPEDNKLTYVDIQKNKDDIQLISINGIILATDLGKAGSSFIPIFDKITSTGNSTTGQMEELLGEMSSDMLQHNLAALENLSKQAIDLIDRNLFERAADVRWWSTDSVFWKGLGNLDSDWSDEASKRLAIINASYTMYRDLILVDHNGKIIANSKPENRDKLRRINVSEQSWFRQALQIGKSDCYGVQDVCETELENEELSLIYSGAIIEKGARQGVAIGALGIFFDWEEISINILEGCLPKQGENAVKGSAAVYVNGRNEITATTDRENFATGSVLSLPDQPNERGHTNSGTFEYKGSTYVYGSSRTQGYREYEGLNWTAHVLRPIA